MKPWLLRTLSASLVLAGLAGGLPAQGDEDEYRYLLENAQKRLLKGELSSAESLADEILVAAEEEPEDSRPALPIVHAARVVFAEIASRRGDYEAARNELRVLPDDYRQTRTPALLSARVHGKVGEYDEAIALLLRLVEADAGDLEARYELGAMLWDAGQRGAARQRWQQNVDAPRPDDGVQLAFLGRSHWRLGGREHIELASQALVESLRRAPERPEARTTLGILNFEAYGEAAGFPSGEKYLKKVLEDHGDYEPALLALYRIRSSNPGLDPGTTESYLGRALLQNPHCVEALVMRASNIFDDRRFEPAAEQLDEVLAINPNDKIALCHRAAVAFLMAEMDDYARFRERAVAGDPGWSTPDRILGDHLVALYRFGDALPFYESALALDPDDLAALQGSAKALIYVGDGAEARRRLERAKTILKGFVDPWRNNAIAAQQLLDDEYTTIEGKGFRLRLHRDDAEVLGTYMMPIYQEAAETLGDKYGVHPEEPVTVEVFHTWDDFSVRTTGFRGFTALGACFGPFITLVSPGDGDVRRQDFMWEATVWHEYVHVMTLALSKHRVPRWLTEGFSVYEEKVRDRTWERGMDRELFDAYHNRDIPPIRLLNRLFRGSRILFGYYQGGLIVEVIASRWGFDKALELLRGFGDDLGLEATCQRALGMSSHELDLALLEYVEQKKLRSMKLVPRWDDTAVQRLLGKAAADRSDLPSRVALAWAFVQRRNPVDAGRWLAEVLRADPENGDALLVRAEMLYQRKEIDAAIDCWRRGFAAGADDFDSRIRCGEALLGINDLAGAEDQWQRAKACWPNCTEQENAPELLLARLYRDRNDRGRAQMEMKTYCNRTARAFTPRMTLADFERDEGHREQEVRYLEECNRIDPFHRGLHVQLGEAYEAVDKRALAAREFEMAAAVPPSLDRRYLGPNATPPAADAPDELAERGELWVRAAKLRRALGDRDKAEGLLQRTLREAPASSAADEARALQR
ncbi:MAG: tetratricopeptide repeat protein [Planctomycetes bacterium]|nr:tetratricopeptide repeat protein [Planctomycetota bacterium]